MKLNSIYVILTSFHLGLMSHDVFFHICYSKSGRPPKKLSDRRGFSRLGPMANGDSPDCSGKPFNNLKL